MLAAQRLSTAFVMVAIAAVPIFVVLRFGGSGAFDDGSARVLLDGLAIAAIVTWLVAAIRRHAWLPESKLSLAIVAVLGTFAITTLTSRSPRLSAEMTVYALLLVELYLLLVALMRRPRFRVQFERVAVVLAMLVSALYLLQVGWAWLEWWTIVGRIAIPPLRPGYLGLLINPNPLATVALAFGAFGLATVSWRRRASSVVATCLIILIAIAVVLTGSRGAWLGLAAGLTTCALLVLATYQSARGWIVSHARTRSGVIVAGLLVMALGAAAVLAAVSGRLTLDDHGYRASFAAASLRIFQSAPLLGVGPGLWRVLRGEYTLGDEINAYLPHAHNVYLQALAEFGVLAVVAGIVIAVSLARLIWEALRSTDPKHQRVGLAAVFVLGLLAAQQLVDMLMNVPAVFLALALPIAWVDGASLGEPKPGNELEAGPESGSGRILRVVSVGMLVGTVVCGVGLAQMESIAATDAAGVAAANAGDWAEAASQTSAAAREDSAVAAYAFSAGLAAAASGDAAEAARWSAQSAAVDDYPYAWLNLAALRYTLADASGSRDALDRAERLSTRRSPVALAAGWLRWQLGDRLEAEADFAAALAADPTLLSDPYWQAMPAVQSDWPKLVSDARERVSATTLDEGSRVTHLFRFDVLSGDYASASVMVSRMPNAAQPMYQAVLDAWRSGAGAEDALIQLAEAHPSKLDLVRWCQLLAARRGDDDAVRRFSDWMWLTDGSGTDTPVARVSTAVPEPNSTVGLDNYQHVYRRPVAGAQLIALLPQVVYQQHF